MKEELAEKVAQDIDLLEAIEVIPNHEIGQFKR